MLDIKKPEQPSLAAIELCQKFQAPKDQAITSRAMAAQLRRDAKAAALKVDALAMKKKAKELSAQAATCKKGSEKTHSEFVTQVEFVHSLLTRRMPASWQEWGVVKTQAYTNLIDLVATQLRRVHVNAPLTASALQQLNEYESWSPALMGELAILKPTAKTITA